MRKTLSWNRKLRVGTPQEIVNLTNSPLQKFIPVEDDDGHYFVLVPYIEGDRGESSIVLAELLVESFNVGIFREEQKEEEKNG